MLFFFSVSSVSYVLKNLCVLCVLSRPISRWKLAFDITKVQTVAMRTTVNLDKDLAGELDHVVSLTKEEPAVVIRQAIRAGLPVVANRFAAPRPEGYFADAYKPNVERQRLEKAMLKVRQRPER